jgi:hypothetical protein
MRTHLQLTASAVLTAALLAAGRPAPAQHAHEAGPSGMHRPALATGAAIAPDGALWVAALDGQGHLYVQSSHDEGRHWNPPVPVDTRDETVAADGENRPSLAFGPGGVAVIAYTMPLARPYTGEVHLLRSTDGGGRFGPPFVLQDDRQEITHRFPATAFDSRGDLYVVWVDKRDAVGTRAAGDAYEGAAIYAKVSHDGGANWEPDRLLAAHSCECCRIALADSPASGLVALWRHVFPGNVRDHAFARLADAGSGADPVRATQDGWQVAACPHHGPGLAPAADGGFHAVWYGVRDGRARARYGRLNASGHPASVPLELMEGAEHAGVMAWGQAVTVFWRRYDGESTRLEAWESSDGGAHFKLHALAATRGANDHPRAAQRGALRLVVWRTEEGMGVYRAGG